MFFREEVTAIKDSILYWYWIFLCLISSKLPRQTFDHLQVSLDSSCLYWLPETNESVKCNYFIFIPCYTYVFLCPHIVKFISKSWNLAMIYIVINISLPFRIHLIWKSLENYITVRIFSIEITKLSDIFFPGV